jgi:hypothetical protein
VVCPWQVTNLRQYPAPAASGAGMQPSFTPRKPLPCVDYQRQAMTTARRRLCSSAPRIDDR